MNIDNKSIVVTGANRGIGAAIVRALLKHKVARVYAAARNIDSLPDFVDVRVVPMRLDITDQKQVQEAAALAKDAHILINNAGTAHFGGVLNAEPGAAEADMTTNYFGTLYMTRAFAPVLEKNAPGIIANVSSVVGLAAIPAVGTYSASKAAMQALTQSVRAELAPRGVRVLGIYPGPIDTDMAKDFPMQKVSADHAAERIVAGLIAGDEYIFPDPMSAGTGALWKRDPVALERQFAAG